MKFRYAFFGTMELFAFNGTPIGCGVFTPHPFLLQVVAALLDDQQARVFAIVIGRQVNPHTFVQEDRNETIR